MSHRAMHYRAAITRFKTARITLDVGPEQLSTAYPHTEEGASEYLKDRFDNDHALRDEFEHVEKTDYITQLMPMPDEAGSMDAVIKEHQDLAIENLRGILGALFMLDTRRVEIHCSDEAYGLEIFDIALRTSRVENVDTGISFDAEHNPELILWCERYLNTSVELETRPTSARPRITSKLQLIRIQIREAILAAKLNFDEALLLAEHRFAKKPPTNPPPKTGGS